jgi:integrase
MAVPQVLQMPQVATECEPEQLALFAELAIDMGQLRRSVLQVQESHRSAATARELRQDWTGFLRFCRGCGRAALPATPDTVQLYVAYALKRENKVSTIRRRLWAIGEMHRAQNAKSPVTEEVRSLVASAARQRKEAVRQSSPMTPELLMQISRSLPKTAAGVRDRAILLLGFGAAMRRVEISALDLADVTLNRRGVSVRIRSSKTDQKGEGRTVGVFEGKKSFTCPLRALKAWLSLRGKGAGPLFTRVMTGDVIGDARLSGEAVCDVVKRSVSLVGLDPSTYSGHALRSGSITAAVQHGVPESVVMRQLSGHRSHAVLAKYVRKASTFAVNPLSGCL